jgi:hypothetical protein
MWRRQISIKESTPLRFYMPFRQIGILGLATVLIGFALALTFTPKTMSNIQGYTSLWILPGTEAQPDAPLIGIHSQELEITHYHLLITYNGQPEQEWRDITLVPGEQWQQRVTMPAGQGVMEAILYRIDSPGVVYRRVVLTLNQ